MGSNYEIYPQSVTLYPADTQLFQVRGFGPPYFWEDVSDCSIESDFTLKVVGSPTDLRGFGTNTIRSGIGSVEWTLTAQCLPTTGGFLEVFIQTRSTIVTYRLTVKVNPTNYTVYDITPTLLDTIATTPAVGHVIKIEIAGNILRFYLNGTLETEYSFPAANMQKDAYYGAYLDLPVSSGSATIPQPALYGDWNATEGLDWTYTSSGGTGSASVNSSAITYTAGTTPGVYTLIAYPYDLAAVTGKDYERVTSTITIPPLSIVGSTAVTLNAGETARFRTNYDDAQSSLVTWSVITGGGGTFDASNLYTAPSTIGEYTLRAASGNQRADVIVTVPASISPAYEYVKPSEVVDWDTSIASPTWTASAGSINSSTGVWTAPSVVGQKARITATNSVSAVRDVTVLEAFPYNPSATIPVDVQLKVITAEAEDGTRYSRVKSFNGQERRRFELRFNNRDVDELEAAIAFWREYYPGKVFMFLDYVMDTRLPVTFESLLNYEADATCAINYSFTILEAVQV